jgi:hypothetical protein
MAFESHAGRHHSAGACDPGHLPDTGRAVLHELDDELREDGIELVVAKRQLLGGCDSNVGAADAVPTRLDVPLGGIDGGYLLGPEAVGERSGERSGTASDVKGALSGADAGGVDQAGCQLCSVSPDVAVIRLRRLA